ncbi:Hypothetical_protein [Hexamita inflata]|uniref:Hypothetical_protein n=1 Tax=Hexamita inflata TaxID=28002 RepID=A0AA86PV97_9EUKA|nr:Hypothetical protein HINF_LOCUS33116 [Hexamita inflata]
MADNNNLNSDVPVTFDMPVTQIPVQSAPIQVQEQKMNEHLAGDQQPTTIQAPMMMPQMAPIMPPAWNETVDNQNIQLNQIYMPPVIEDSHQSVQMPPMQPVMQGQQPQAYTTVVVESKKDSAAEDAAKCIGCCVCFSYVFMTLWQMIQCIFMCIFMCCR